MFEDLIVKVQMMTYCNFVVEQIIYDCKKVKELEKKSFKEFGRKKRDVKEEKSK